MKKLAKAIIIVMTIIAWTSTAASASEREPSYLILRAPSRVQQGSHAKQGPGQYSGRGYEVRTQAYAYGWFGVQRRQHLRRSTGYNESYIQWSQR